MYCNRNRSPKPVSGLPCMNEAQHIRTSLVKICQINGLFIFPCLCVCRDGMVGTLSNFCASNECFVLVCGRAYFDNHFKVALFREGVFFVKALPNLF